MTVAVTEVETVGVCAFDLGADADRGDGLGAGPVLDSFAETLACAGAACGIAHDEAADVDGIGSLEVLLDDAMDPANEAFVQKRGEDDVAGGAGEGFDA